MGSHHSVSEHLVTQESGFIKHVGTTHLERVGRQVKTKRPLLWDLYRGSCFGFAANGMLMFALYAACHDFTFHTFLLPWWLEAGLLIVQSWLSYMADVVCEFEERRKHSSWYRLDRLCATLLLSNSVGRMLLGNLPLIQRLIAATGFVGLFCYFREISLLQRRRLMQAMQYHTCWHFSMCMTAMVFNLWSAGCQIFPQFGDGGLQWGSTGLWVGCLIGLEESSIGSNIGSGAGQTGQLLRQAAAAMGFEGLAAAAQPALLAVF